MKRCRKPRLFFACSSGLSGLLLLALAMVLGLNSAWAKSGADATAEIRRYVITLQDPPLAAYTGGELSDPGPQGPLRLAATAPESTGEKRLNVRSPESLAYLAYLEKRHAELTAELEALLGRTLEIPHRYRVATNGLALHLTPAEAERARDLPQVRSVAPDQVYRLQTYAGPQWLGADAIWEGLAGYPDARGEGVVVGVIDSGINWDHPSFSDDAEADFSFQNPYGEGLGLCSDPEVLCNQKLVGVYDFVTDDPETPDVEEEYTKGKDNDGHGSHTASIAAGRAIDVTSDGASRTISGVAPRANLVTYRVCYIGITDPESSDNGGCQGSAILSAIDQAIVDGVDVINYSIGGDPRNPWQPGSDHIAFLNARAAGIFIASSAGNSGPNPGTVGAPALAPWIVAVGNATHNLIRGTVVDNFTGGASPAPEALIGASLRGGSGKLPIVHARDYGFPLCGTGPAELGATCTSNTGASNPWAGERPFNGEIVVCDRGTYGRVEKGRNVQLAGASGFILANADGSLQNVVADTHCLPASHLGQADGDILRTWLASGDGHGAQISSVMDVESDAAADELAVSSSRGPAGESYPTLGNLLKPNLIAPGTQILAAYSDLSVRKLSGTSMASPHVAGAAALIKSVHPDWTANELVSAIETTATQALAKDENGDPATTEQVGAGRPQIDEAVNIGFYFDVSRLDFMVSNPDPQVRGDLRRLNLPSLVDAECASACVFQRTATDLMGGGTWSATAEGFPDGAVVTVTPDRLTLPSGGSRTFDITVDVSNSGVIGEWVSGKVRFSAAGAADQYLTVSVKSFGGTLPEELEIADARNGGWQTFELDGLVALPDATFTSGGLVKRDARTENLVEDPTNDDPYDGGEGVFTSWYNLEAGALWLYAETPASSSADVDLFVGRDDNGNGRADEWEELCSSTSSNNLERCDLTDLAPGNYWVLVQNWTAGESDGDEVTLLSAAVEANAGSGLAASGPGIVGANEAFPLRLSWEDLPALPGETWFGAVGVGSSRETPNNLGVIPVRFTRSGIAPASTYPLMNGRDHRLAVAAGGTHDRLFIDIPAGTETLSIQASGADAIQSDNLRIDLVRLDFDEALANPPFATPADGRPVVASASGGGGLGPQVIVTGGVAPGRWYPVVRNEGGEAAAVSIRAEVEQGGTAVDPHPGLWEPSSRPLINQGFEFNWADDPGSPHFMVWYTYDEAGRPMWFFASAERDGQNVWTADLLRVTNDGAEQKLQRVGGVSLTLLATDDAMFSYTLYGESGTERMMKQSRLTCPQPNGTPASYTGHWFRGPAFSIVGELERAFTSESAGQWTLDFVFDPPLAGSVQRTDSIVKLSHRIDCE
ncbi:MAG: S8 family serine peptidase [Xanthomonadales bacterium]